MSTFLQLFFFFSEQNFCFLQIAEQYFKCVTQLVTKLFVWRKTEGKIIVCVFFKPRQWLILLQQLKISLAPLSRWPRDGPTHFLKSLHFGNEVHLCSRIPPTNYRSTSRLARQRQLCQWTTHLKISSYLEVGVNNQTTNSDITTSTPQTHQHLAGKDGSILSHSAWGGGEHCLRAELITLCGRIKSVFSLLSGLRLCKSPPAKQFTDGGLNEPTVSLEAED